MRSIYFNSCYSGLQRCDSGRVFFTRSIKSPVTGHPILVSCPSLGVLAQPDNSHFVLRHVMHGVADATGAVARKMADSKRHPVNPEGGVIVDHDGGGIELIDQTRGDIEARRKPCRLECVGQCV